MHLAWHLTTQHRRIHSKNIPTTETMRKYPPVQALVRVCTKEFRVPGTELDLDVGTAVLIPVYAIHHDPQYYPEPDTFNPDRFAKDCNGGGGDNGRPAGVYLPFGDGPRICIGIDSIIYVYFYFKYNDSQFHQIIIDFNSNEN